MVDFADIVEPEWLHWYQLTPAERLRASDEAWANYLELGGSLDPDIDSQSPFWSREELAEFAKNAAEARARAFRQSAATPDEDD